MKVHLVTIAVIIACVKYTECNLSFLSSYPEDATLNMVQLLSKYGYPSEVHYVTTADGYILKIYRIPYRCHCTPEKQKRPVLLFHCLLSNSLDYIVTGPGKGLGYLLADACYDVWLINSRGNFESRNHTTLNPNKKEFWSFSWHEMGKFDVPAVIDYVLDKTNKSQVHCVGHSQGNTQLFVFSSLNPADSSRKIKSIHALAPVAFMSHIKNVFFQFLAKHIAIEKMASDKAGIYEFMAKNANRSDFETRICSVEHPLFLNPCAMRYFAIAGYDCKQFNATLMQIVRANNPAGASVREFVHYAQLINSGKFRPYDRDMDFPLGNLITYGRLSPPDYDIGNIKVPMHLFYADNDLLSSPVDVQHFSSMTPSSRLYRIPFERFNHFDYVFADDVKKYVNDVILQNLAAYYT